MQFKIEMIQILIQWLRVVEAREIITTTNNCQNLSIYNFLFVDFFSLRNIIKRGKNEKILFGTSITLCFD